MQNLCGGEGTDHTKLMFKVEEGNGPRKIYAGKGNGPHKNYAGKGERTTQKLCGEGRTDHAKNM